MSVDEEIGKLISSRDNMRYPASEIGFPAQVPGEYVLRHYQKPLVMAIKRELDIRDSEFNQLILPMLINFANFVHLFPASENHHHRAATGLLRHSLEVCFQCIRRSKTSSLIQWRFPYINQIVHSDMTCSRSWWATSWPRETIYRFWSMERRRENSLASGPWTNPCLGKENNVKRYYLVWKRAVTASIPPARAICCWWSCQKKCMFTFLTAGMIFSMNWPGHWMPVRSSMQKNQWSGRQKQDPHYH